MRFTDPPWWPQGNHGGLLEKLESLAIWTPRCLLKVPRGVVGAQQVIFPWGIEGPAQINKAITGCAHNT